MYLVSSKLPNFDERVLVKTSEGYMFTARLMKDEEGDYWVADLPSSMNTDYSEVQEEIISWEYVDEL